MGRYECEIVEGDKWEYEADKRWNLLHLFQAKSGRIIRNDEFLLVYTASHTNCMITRNLKQTGVTSTA